MPAHEAVNGKQSGKQTERCSPIGETRYDTEGKKATVRENQLPMIFFMFFFHSLHLSLITHMLFHLPQGATLSPNLPHSRCTASAVAQPSESPHIVLLDSTITLGNVNQFISGFVFPLSFAFPPLIYR